jgi:hypothetical protein
MNMDLDTFLTSSRDKRSSTRNLAVLKARYAHRTSLDKQLEYS